MTEQPADAERSEAIQRLEQEFAHLFSRIRKLFQEAGERVSPGLLPTSYRVLKTIANQEPVTASELTQALAFDKGQMSRVIKELTGLGLIDSSVDPQDGRVRTITTTQHGKDRLALAHGPLHQGFYGALFDWPIEDIQTFTRMLHDISADRTDTTAEQPA